MHSFLVILEYPERDSGVGNFLSTVHDKTGSIENIEWLQAGVCLIPAEQFLCFVEAIVPVVAACNHRPILSGDRGQQSKPYGYRCLALPEVPLWLRSGGCRQ